MSENSVIQRCNRVEAYRRNRCPAGPTPRLPQSPQALPAVPEDGGARNTDAVGGMGRSAG